MTEIQMGVLEGLLDWTTEMAKENPDTTIWEMERDALKAAIKELEVKK